MTESHTKYRNKRSTGKLVVLNEEELIQQVCCRPILYDRTLKAYRKSGLRHTYWKEVGQSMNAPVEECRKRWRSLRDAFSKHYKQNSRVDGHVKRKKWVFYDQMSFIGPYLDNASCEIDEQLLDDFADNSEDADAIILSPAQTEDCEVENSQHHDDTNLKDSTQHLKPEKEEQKFVTNLTMQSNDFLPLPIEECSISEDRPVVGTATVQSEHQRDAAVAAECESNEKFLLSCAPVLHRLTNRKNALARLKIQQILFEIEFGESDH